MARPKSRTQPCDRSGGMNRLAQADSFLMAAELILDDGTDDGSPGVAAALAVLAGIAASDAACCARLGARSRGQSHIEAVDLVGTVAPHGADMAKDLTRLLNRKDDSHYGVAFVSTGDAMRMVGWAKRLVGRAREAVET
jgi:hypothetical protein